MVTAPMTLKVVCSLEESYDKYSILKAEISLYKQRYIYAKLWFFKESCSGAIKKAEHRRPDYSELWCWRRLESPLDFKEIKEVNPKGNQP